MEDLRAHRIWFWCFPSWMEPLGHTIWRMGVMDAARSFFLKMLAKKQKVVALLLWVRKSNVAKLETGSPDKTYEHLFVWNDTQSWFCWHCTSLARKYCTVCLLYMFATHSLSLQSPSAMSSKLALNRRTRTSLQHQSRTRAPDFLAKKISWEV